MEQADGRRSILGGRRRASPAGVVRCPLASLGVVQPSSSDSSEQDSSGQDDGLLGRLRAVADQAGAAAVASGRHPGDVRLLLATKTIEPARILRVMGAGQTLIGENRVQEVVAKAPELAARRTRVSSHRPPAGQQGQPGAAVRQLRPDGGFGRAGPAAERQGRIAPTNAGCPHPGERVRRSEQIRRFVRRSAGSARRGRGNTPHCGSVGT